MFCSEMEEKPIPQKLPDRLRLRTLKAMFGPV